MNDLSSSLQTPVADSPTPDPGPVGAPSAKSSSYYSWLRLTLYALMLATMLGFTGKLFWWADYFAHPRLHLAAGLTVIGLLLILKLDFLRAAIAAAGIVLNFIAVTSAIPETGLAPNANGIPPGEVKVVQLNVNVYNANGQAIASWVRSENPDILILTEANRTWLPILDSLVPTLPYQRMINNSGEFGMAILSRFPFDKVENGSAGPKSLPVLKVEIESPLGRIAVVGVHGSAPSSGTETRSRDHYFAQVAAMVQTNGLPTIIAGDFNATPWSSGFESLRLLPNLKPDSLDAQATWPAALGQFGVPTSHILLSIPYSRPAPIAFSSLHTGPALYGTEHLPLVAVLSIEQ